MRKAKTFLAHLPSNCMTASSRVLTTSIMKFRYNLAAFVLSLTALFAASFAQTAPTATPPPSDDDGDVIKVNSRLVVVPVSVTDSAGEPVTGLSTKDFKLTEENRAQVIDNVGSADVVPLEIALLIDVSGSVDPLFEFERAAAAQFLKSVMKPSDRATVFLIGESTQVVGPRSNADEAAARLAAITKSGSQTPTAFYDAVAAATQFLEKNAPQTSRKVILALTDGEDNWSASTRSAETANYRDIDVNRLTTDTLNKIAGRTDAAHRKAQARITRDIQNADTVFYAINPAGASYKLNKISLRAQTGLQAFADQTGGTAFLPNFAPVDTKDALQNSGNAKRNSETLARIFKRLENELRAQYLVQYYSDADYPRDKFVKVNVSLQTPAGRTLRAREGYFVKN